MFPSAAIKPPITTFVRSLPLSAASMYAAIANAPSTTPSDKQRPHAAARHAKGLVRFRLVVHHHPPPPPGYESRVVRFALVIMTQEGSDRARRTP
jgi:hypothetical protein